MKFFLRAINLQSILLISSLAAQAVAETKKFVTPDNYTWVYDHQPARHSKPTLLLLHGFPGSRKDWTRQVEDLSSAGYGVIAPDLLGFGDSDKPIQPQKYRLSTLGKDIDAIIGHEGLDSVIGVGHDWGSPVLSATVIYYPKRFQKLVFVDIGYTPPDGFDIDSLNAIGLETWGYTPFGYWYFFNSPDAPDIIRGNIESFWNLLYPVDNSLWRVNLASIAGARTWLSRNTTTTTAAYRNESDKAAWIKFYSVPGNLEASLNTYRSGMRGVQNEDAKNLTEADKVLKVPVLGIKATQDQLGRPEFLTRSTEPYAQGGYTEKSLACGHWVMFEKGKELSDMLLEFAGSK